MLGFIDRRDTQSHGDREQPELRLKLEILPKVSQLAKGVKAAWEMLYSKYAEPERLPFLSLEKLVSLTADARLALAGSGPLLFNDLEFVSFSFVKDKLPPCLESYS